MIVEAQSDGSICSNQNQFSPMIVEVSVGDTDPGEYFMKGPTDLVSLWSFTSNWSPIYWSPIYWSPTQWLKESLVHSIQLDNCAIHDIQSAVHMCHQMDYIV